MPGLRSTVGSRGRRSWLPVIAGIGVIVVLAGAGAAVYLVKFHPAKQTQPRPLATQVEGFQTVGLVAQAAQAPSTELVQLLSPQGTPSFTQVGAAQAASGQPEWNADLMSDGTYIFIYVPTGRCLASAGPAKRPHLVVSHCDLGKQQRWRRLTTSVVQDGHPFYQFASAVSGKCIAQISTIAGTTGLAGLANCSPSHPASELLSFWWSGG